MPLASSVPKRAVIGIVVAASVALTVVVWPRGGDRTELQVATGSPSGGSADELPPFEIGGESTTTSTAAPAETTSTTSGSTSTTTRPATSSTTTLNLPGPGSTVTTLPQGPTSNTTLPGAATTTTTAPPVDPRWVVDMAARPDGSGGWIVRADGSVDAFGNAPALGGAVGKVNSTVVEIASTPSGEGYWIVDTLGEVLTFGDARMLGHTGNIPLNHPIVAMAPTTAGDGYYLLASDGGVFSFGAAAFYGSTGNIKLQKPEVSMAVSPVRVDGWRGGYWMVTGRGELYAFGDGAEFFCSPEDLPLTQPFVDLAASPDGDGYFLVDDRGGVFPYGAAEHHGNDPHMTSPAVAIVSTPTGLGYWIAARDGSVLEFGDAATFFAA